MIACVLRRRRCQLCKASSRSFARESVARNRSGTRQCGRRTTRRSHPSGLEIHPVAALQKKFEEAAKRFEQDVIASFPGYRPASFKRGKFIYVFDEEDPYRIPVELSLRPNSTSALTPEVPPIFFEARGTVDGEWKMPGQAALREMQAAASARAASQSHAGRRAPEPASPLQAPKGSSARIISWGDEDSCSSPVFAPSGSTGRGRYSEREAPRAHRKL